MREQNAQLVEEFNECLKYLREQAQEDEQYPKKTFYEKLLEFDYSAAKRKRSPTKRLIQMRESPLIEHSTPSKDEKLYLRTPNKAYLVEKEDSAEEEKLMKLAYKKNPSAFVEKVAKKR